MTATEIRRFSEVGPLTASVAGALITTIVERQNSTGRMRMVLTGGRTAHALLNTVLRTPARSAIDMSAWEIWWSDERFLPAGHPDRNDQSVGGMLASPYDNAPVLHSIAGPDEVSSPEESALRYQQTLPAEGWDLVVLSLGEDGHIASIFPESPAVHSAASVLAVHGAPKEPPTRVTLSTATLSRADEVWILATGAAKSAAVRLAFDTAAGPFQMPVRGVRGRLRTVWYVDDDAADRLPAGFGRRD